MREEHRATFGCFGPLFLGNFRTFCILYNNLELGENSLSLTDLFVDEILWYFHLNEATLIKRLLSA